MSTETKIGIFKGILIVILIAICILGANGLLMSGGNSNKIDNIAEKADAVAYIFNTRYNPNDVDIEKIKNVCDEKTISQVTDVTKSVETNKFISLEEQFEVYGNNTIEEEDGFGNIVQVNISDTEDTDASVQTVDGVRGVYIDDIYIKDNGKFDITICGNDIEVEVPENVILGQMVFNPSYCFKVESYNYYDNGTFIVNLISDTETAFERDIKSRIEINDNAMVEGDFGTLLSSIQNTDDKIQLTREIYDEFREQIVSNYGGIRKTVRCKIINDKITDINMESLKSL